MTIVTEDENDKLKAIDLHNAYRRWIEERYNEKSVMTLLRFSKKLSSHIDTMIIVFHTKIYTNIKIKNI